MNAERRKAVLFAGAAVAASVAGVALVPHEGVASMLGAQALSTLFPATFGAWSIDPSVVPLEPGAELQKTIAESYDQVVSRTYADNADYRVMLSAAYGGRRNLGMDIHRPEICYPAQGLALRSDTRVDPLVVDGHSLPLRRLVAGTGERNEPISYWLVIGRGVATFGLGHRLALLKYGLTGRVPDGMLVRVSSIDDDPSYAFTQHDSFLRDLLRAVTPGFRERLLGLG